MKVITTNVNKAIGLSQILQKNSAEADVNALVRSHLDYGNMIYDGAYNETFHQKFESMQHNTCLALSETF